MKRVFHRNENVIIIKKKSLRMKKKLSLCRWYWFLNDIDHRWNLLSGIGFCVRHCCIQIHATDLILCRLINTSYLSIHKTWEEEVMRGSWVHRQDPLPQPVRGLHQSEGHLPAEPSGRLWCWCERVCVTERHVICDFPLFLFAVCVWCEEGGGWGVDLLTAKRKESNAQRGERGEPRHRLRYSPGTKTPPTHARIKATSTTLFYSVSFILQVELNRKYRMHSAQQKVAGSIYINSRCVFLRKELKEGRYVIIPTTFDPAQQGDFLLRVFTDVPSDCK